MSSDPTLNKSQTDWQRLDAMRDEEIDLSDCPEVTPAQFAKAVVHKQESTSVKVDRDVLEWFKLHNQDYQTEINQLLRSYMESHRP